MQVQNEKLVCVEFVSEEQSVRVEFTNIGTTTIDEAALNTLLENAEKISSLLRPHLRIANGGDRLYIIRYGIYIAVVAKNDTLTWLPLWGSWHRRMAVTLRPQACASEQPPVGRLLASRREGCSLY